MGSDQTLETRRFTGSTQGDYDARKDEAEILGGAVLSKVNDATETATDVGGALPWRSDPGDKGAYVKRDQDNQRKAFAEIGEELKFKVTKEQEVAAFILFDVPAIVGSAVGAAKGGVKLAGVAWKFFRKEGGDVASATAKVLKASEKLGAAEAKQGTAIAKAASDGAEQTATQGGKVAADSARKKTWQGLLPDAQKRLAATKKRLGNPSDEIVGMAMSRKDALARIESRVSEIEKHLGVLEAEPGAQAVNHWRKEVKTWLADVDQALPHVGKKTAEEWAPRISEWRRRLGE